MMKKVMFGLAAIAAGVAVADVTSANVVGYVNYDREAQFRVGGNMFVSPGNGETWDLCDLKVVGGSEQDDRFSFLLPNIASIDSSKVFSYTSPEEAWDPGDDGWYIERLGQPRQKILSYPVPAGTGLMCKLTKAGTSITYAGQVVTGNAQGKIVIEKPAGTTFRFIANPLPYDVDILDIEMENCSELDDKISKLYPNIAAVDASTTVSYMTADRAWEPEEVGWYKGQTKITERGQWVLKAGEGFYANCPSAGVKIIFNAPNLSK